VLPGSAWANGPPQHPAAKAAALEKAVSAARAAGASSDAVLALQREVQTAKQSAADKRPLGARLDSAKAKVARAENKLAAADYAVQQAIERQDEAKSQVEAERQELLALEKEVASSPAPPHMHPASMAQTMRALMEGAQALLSGLGAAGCQLTPEGMPQPLRESMQSLDAAVAAAKTAQQDTPLAEMELDGGGTAEGLADTEADTLAVTQRAGQQRQEPKETEEEGNVGRNEAEGAQDAQAVAASLKLLVSKKLDDASYVAAARQVLRAGPYF